MSIRVGLEKRYWDGRKRWVWQARWRDQFGKPRARSLKTRDSNEARALAVAIEEKLNAGVVAQSGRDTHWERAWETYYLLHEGTKELSTLENEAGSWKQFWAWAPVTRMEHVTVLHTTAWRDYLLKERGVSTRTCNDHLTRCGTVYNKLTAKGIYGGFNAFAVVERLSSDTAVKDWLKRSEALDLLTQAQDTGRDLHLFVALGIYAGLRPFETLSVRWDWIHWPGEAGATGWLAIPKKDDQFRAKKDKARNIPLAPELRELLQFYRDGSPRAYVVAPFATQGKGRGRWNPRKSFHSAVKAAGLGHRKVTPYTLRHTFGSNAVNAKVALYTVMDWMGHSDVRTLQIYGHMDADNPDITRVYAPAKEG